MERRSEPRLTVILPVEVWRHGRLMTRLSSIDVARGGMCLRVASGEPPARALVDVVVGAGGERHTHRALVRYVCGSRAGLLFADEADVLWGELHERFAPARRSRGHADRRRAREPQPRGGC